MQLALDSGQSTGFSVGTNCGEEPASLESLLLPYVANVI